MFLWCGCVVCVSVRVLYDFDHSLRFIGYYFVFIVVVCVLAGYVVWRCRLGFGLGYVVYLVFGFFRDLLVWVGFNFLKTVLISSALCRCLGLVPDVRGWVFSLGCFIGSLLGLWFGFLLGLLGWFDLINAMGVPVPFFGFGLALVVAWFSLGFAGCGYDGLFVIRFCYF